MGPNLFILGAGKSGTTTLWETLGTFPEVHVCSPKEPSFFCSYFQIVSNPIDYLHLFSDQHRWNVDSSHVYLSNPESAQAIKSYFPDSRFIVILRDPRERAHSLYCHMRRHHHDDGKPLEPIPTFLEALLAEEHRSTDDQFFRECRQYFWNFLYMRSAAYDEQLARYLNLWPRDRFLFLSLAGFERYEEAAVQRIADFIGLSPPPFSTVGKVNAGRAGAGFGDQERQLMDAYFGNLMQRTEALIGERLDWSL